MTQTQYVPTYCNFPHRLRDGKPIKHECAIIPPAALQAEIAGDWPLANELMEKGKTARYFGQPCFPISMGVKADPET